MDVDQEPKPSDEMSPVEVEQLVSGQFVQQPNDNEKLPIELTNATGTYFHHINDDCLLNIFTETSLSLMDLRSLAKTCTRFQQLIQRVFPKDLIIDFWSNEIFYVSSRKYSSGISRPSHDIDGLFKNFGSTLSEVSTSTFSRTKSDEASTYLLNLVSEYCVDNLETLRIGRMKIPAVLTDKLKPIFKRLQRLELIDVRIEGNQTLFAGLDSLIELTIRNVENCTAVLGNVFPQLQRFIYSECIDLSPTTLPIFFSRHRKLKALDMRTTVEPSILQVIVNSCKELEELRLDFGRTRLFDLQPLQDLKSLQILQLDGLACGDLQFLSHLTKLRELRLCDCRLPKDPKQFYFSTQLTKLHLRLQDGSHADVVDIIRRLINLEELTVYGIRKNILDEKTLSEIVAVVEGRSTVLLNLSDGDYNFVLKSNKQQVELRKIRLWSTERYNGIEVLDI